MATHQILLSLQGPGHQLQSLWDQCRPAGHPGDTAPCSTSSSNPTFCTTCRTTCQTACCATSHPTCRTARCATCHSTRHLACCATSHPIHRTAHCATRHSTCRSAHRATGHSTRGATSCATRPSACSVGGSAYWVISWGWGAPLPQILMRRIRALEFVDMRELLPEEVAGGGPQYGTA